MDKREIARLIASRISTLGPDYLKSSYKASGSIKHLIIDDLLPEDLALSLFRSFPPLSSMRLLNGPQEKKYVCVDFDDEAKLVEASLLAFQEIDLVSSISEITSIHGLQPDSEMYAAGISRMTQNCFLNPHIDNSHNRNRTKYRRINVLYYINPDLEPCSGGSLLLYPDGLRNKPICIEPKHNRLVIMMTDKKSIHAVSRVTNTQASRNCISSYYFTDTFESEQPYYHSTSFYGFPGQYIKHLRLRLGSKLRTATRVFLGNHFQKFFANKHYRKQ